MEIEQIITRPDRSRVKIKVNLYVDWRGFHWGVFVGTCPPGKRKYSNKNEPSAATQEEINQVKQQLLDKLKDWNEERYLSTPLVYCREGR